MNKKIILGSALVLACMSLAGCNASDFNHAKDMEDSSSAKTEKAIDMPFGSWVDKDDGAALSFNSNGTGRYVYADPNNPDTDDHFTWKEIKKGTYQIDMEDPDVSGPLTMTITGDRTMALSGNGGWNTEVFTLSKKSVDLDQFLADRGENASDNDASSSNSTEETGGETTEHHHNSAEEAKQLLESQQEELGITGPIGDPIKEMPHSWIFSVNINGEGQRDVMVSDSGRVQELDVPQGAELN